MKKRSSQIQFETNTFFENITCTKITIINVLKTRYEQNSILKIPHSAKSKIKMLKFRLPQAVRAGRQTARANCVVSHGSFCGRQMREQLKKDYLLNI